VRHLAGSRRDNTNASAPGPISPAATLHRATLFGCCERKSGITPFDRLVGQGMEQPCRQARSVFRFVDKGSSYRELASIRWLCQR